MYNEIEERLPIRPLTKIIATLLVAVWAIALPTPMALLLLFLGEVLVIIGLGLWSSQYKALLTLVGFAIFLGLVQYLGSANLVSAYVSGLRMLCMTSIFIVLLGSTSLQDLTAALVLQCKIPHEYAFMFTSALRFVPDFLAESKSVREAQICRGMSVKGSLMRRLQMYASVWQPLVLKSLGRSETMALALELKGFGGKEHRFINSVALRGIDYGLIACMVGVTVYVLVR